MRQTHNSAIYFKTWKHGRFPILFTCLIWLFSLSNPIVSAQNEPSLTLTASAPAGPFAVGDEVFLGLSLTNPFATPLASVQFDLPYVPEVSYTAVPGATEAIPGGTLNLGDITTTVSLTLTAEILSFPAGGDIVLPLQVRTAATDPVSTTVTLAITPPAEGEGSVASLIPIEPTQWQFTHTPPGVSSFTGAATYGYSIPLPPGIGGLAPSLAMSYSSRGADGLVFPATTGGFGAGWGMPQAEIVNGNAARMFDSDPSTSELCPNFSNNALTLSLNGTTYSLWPYDNGSRHGRYSANGDPSLYVEYRDDATNNVTGESWLVRTPDGTEYIFGREEQAEQVIFPLKGDCATVQPPGTGNTQQPRNPRFIAYKWKLESVTDVYGRQIRYIYGTKCGQPSVGDTCRRTFTYPYHIIESTTFPNPDTQPNQQFRTEVDVALEHLEYNFVGGTAQTTVHFEYQVDNWDLVNDDRLMAVGHYRPQRLIIRQASQVVAAYVFAYHPTPYEHYQPGLDTVYEFWWLTGITPYGSDYNPATGTGTALPAPQFFYEQNTGACGNDLEGNPHCVALLTRVNNGYGGVTRFVYDRYNNNGGLDANGKWFVVKEVYTWDGVRYPYTNNNSPAVQRLLYYRTGFTACYDKGGDGCYAQDDPASEALVGFNGVTLDTQKRNNDGTWTTVARGREEYTTTTYWLNGKPTVSQQRDPSDVVLTQTVWDWQLGGTPTWQARLMRQDQYVYAESTLHTYQTTEYDAAYGAVYRVREYRQDTGGDVLYRCTQQEYAHQVTGSIWLINRPWRNTTYNGNCTGTRITETLYRYHNDDNNPANDNTSDLNGKAALEWVHSWAGDPNNIGRYISTHYVYHPSGNADYGLLWKTESFSNFGGSAAYATGLRNTVAVSDYNIVGLPYSAATSSASGTPSTQTQSFTYEALRPWLLTAVTDANSDTSSFEYDTFGRLRKVIRPGDTSGSPTLEYRYSDDTSVVPGPFTLPLYTETRTKNNLQQPAREFYNGLGQLLQTQQAHAEVGNPSADQDIIVTYAYDARGLLTCQTYPYNIAPYTGNGNAYRAADDCLNYPHTTTGYDTLGRTSTVTVPNDPYTGDSVTLYLYGTVTVDSEVYTYQDVVDPNRHRIQHRTDAFGRLVQAVEISGNCGSYIPGYSCGGSYTEDWAVYATTTYAYNRLDQLTSVTDEAGNVTTMTYDALGHKLSMNDPDMGLWQYAYDAPGNLSSQTDAKNQTLTFAYDNFNQLTNKTYGPNTLATYTYDQTAGGNNGIGRLTQVTDTSGSHTFVYDSRGRLTSESRTITGSSATYIMQYGYDALDRLLTTTYPNGEVVATGYNNQGLPESLSGTNNYVAAVTYNAAGQRLNLALGNGRTTTYTYNPLSLRLTSLVTDNYLQNWAYTYDNAGNVATITDALNSNQVQTFQYDHRNRLISAYTNAAGGGQYTHKPETGTGYAYDEIGNLTSYTGWEYVYSPSHKHAVASILVGGYPSMSFVYDNNGNMTNRYDNTGNYTQNWDVENRLTSITKSGVGTAAFSYDADGQRMKQVELDGITTYTPFPGYEVESGTGKDGSSVTMTPLNYGVDCQDAATGSGYIMYSLESVHTRFAASPPNSNNAAHFICVKYIGGQWKYDNRNVYVTFTPRASDVLVASVNFDTDTVTLTNGQNSKINGMMRGYVSGNLVVTPDQWNGVFNDGEFGLSGSSLIPNVTRRLTYSLGGQAVAIRVVDAPINTYNGVVYIHSDHLGSTNLLSNEGGSPRADSLAYYYPFGNWRQYIPSQTITDKGFTGHRSNNLPGGNDLGLIYMNARYYLPGIARFISADFLVPDLANPQSLNRYSYGYNNPLFFIDPSGHISCTSANLPGDDQAACYDPTYNYPSYYDSVGWMTVDPGAVVALETANLSESPHIADIIQTVKSGSEFWNSAFKNGVVMFLTLAGADFISDGAEAISCATSGDWWCAGTSAVATGLIWVPGSAVRGALGAFCSFSGDTLVMTEEGLVPISEVDLNDKVLAYNEETGETGYYPVLAIWAHEDPIIVTLTIDGETIETTPEHPFYTAEGEWIPAASLQVGDEIRTADWSTGTVEAIQFTRRLQIMYNFTVSTAHTYFVGNGQWLVHNDCRTQVLRFMKIRFNQPEFLKIVDNLGIDITGVTDSDLRSVQMREIYLYLERRGRIDELHTAIFDYMTQNGYSDSVIQEFLDILDGG